MLTITIIKTLLLPPALQIILLLLGFILWPFRRKIAITCFFCGFMSLWLLSTPIISHSLYQWLEAPYRDTSSVAISNIPQRAQAIVVLGGGRHYNAIEYNSDNGSMIDTANYHFLWRLRYAAYLANHSKLPVIVSGGIPYATKQESEALLGAQILSHEFGVYPVWQEGNSRNTWENAQLTQPLLQEKGIDHVVLVTQAYHMRRSSYAFTQAGITHTPMATGFLSNQPLDLWWQRWLPNSTALMDSRTALHEYLGLLFYRMK